MQLLKPSFKILHITHLPLHLIEEAGRTCYKSQTAPITDASAQKFCRMLLRHGHESVLEHASATVRLITSRTVSHQLVRHRLASPSQESQRYCDYGQGVRFIVPEWFDDVDAEEILKQDKVDTVDDIYNRWVQCRLQDEREYLTYLAAGLKLEQARTCLPNCAATTIVLTANFRELRHIFRLRTSLRADPEMRRSMLPILAEFQSRIPVIFDDVKDRTDG